MGALPPAAQLYVYYKVAATHGVDAVAAAHALQQELVAHHTGLHCRVLQRADEVGDSVTLMETYTHDRGIDADLAQAIERAAQARMAHLVLGARHVEVFVPCA